MNFNPTSFPIELEYSAANARALRLAADLTIPEAAAASNVKPVTWVAYEQGKIRMPAARWIALKQCIKSGAHDGFKKTPQRRGPVARNDFTPGEYEKPPTPTVINGGALLSEGRSALSITAGQMAIELNLPQAHAVFSRERGVGNVTPDMLSTVLGLMERRLQALVQANTSISSKEDLAQVSEVLRVNHGELGRGAPVGMKEPRKAVFHLITGKKNLTPEIADAISANADRIRLQQVQSLMAAIERFKLALAASQ